MEGRGNIEVGGYMEIVEERETGTKEEGQGRRVRRIIGGAHCKENPIYVLLFWEAHGLSLNFHIHVSVSD
jgi:hypothetical protein